MGKIQKIHTLSPPTKTARTSLSGNLSEVRWSRYPLLEIWKLSTNLIGELLRQACTSSLCWQCVSVENVPDIGGPQVPFVAQWKLVGDRCKAYFFHRQRQIIGIAYSELLHSGWIKLPRADEIPIDVKIYHI